MSNICFFSNNEVIPGCCISHVAVQQCGGGRALA